MIWLGRSRRRILEGVREINPLRWFEKSNNDILATPATFEDVLDILESLGLVSTGQVAILLSQLKRDGQCNGVTVEGRRCRLPASKGKLFCPTHKDQMEDE